MSRQPRTTAPIAWSFIFLGASACSQSSPVAVDSRRPLDSAACPSCSDTGAARRLVLSTEKDITPAGVKLAVRPDSARLGPTTYVGFTNRDSPQTFGLLSLDENLTPAGSRTLAGAGAGADVAVSQLPTDLRIASDGQQTLWCAFETAMVPQTGPSTCRNCLTSAAYRLANGSLSLVSHGEVVCIDWSCDPQKIGPRPEGTILPDDPVPFYDSGKFYILLRKQGPAVLPIHVFDSSFAAQPPFDLDLRPQLGDSTSVSVYSVLRVDGQISIVAALWNGPPTEKNGTSYLALVPLRDDLKAASGPVTTLSRTDDYQAYVSGARYDNGKLYLTHNTHSRQIGGLNKGVLKVFDVRRGFALLEDIVINEGTPGDGHFMDDHLTVETVDGRVHVFFPSPDDRLKVKIFEWR